MLDAIEERLFADGLLTATATGVRPTRRWQAALARATLHLIRAGQDGDDLRVPIAAALIEIYGDALDDEAVAHAIGIMLPVELAELARIGAPME
jgi:hypothetical protein